LETKDKDYIGEGAAEGKGVLVGFVREMGSE